jgi:hypothetical protein
MEQSAIGNVVQLGGFDLSLEFCGLGACGLVTKLRLSNQTKMPEQRKRGDSEKHSPLACCIFIAT